MGATAKGIPTPDLTDAPADIEAAVEPFAEWVDDHAWGGALTTAERDALTGADLWNGRVIYNTTTGRLNHYNGSAWQDRDVSSGGQHIATSETTTATVYGDLATVGPDALVTCGPSGVIVVALGCDLSNSGANHAYMSFELIRVSDSAVIHFTDPRRAIYRVGTGGTRMGVTDRMASLTAGTQYRARAKYRVSAGTGTFAERQLLAWTY